jgi:hypothetical protein
VSASHPESASLYKEDVTVGVKKLCQAAMNHLQQVFRDKGTPVLNPTVSTCARDSCRSFTGMPRRVDIVVKVVVE